MTEEKKEVEPSEEIVVAPEGEEQQQKKSEEEEGFEKEEEFVPANKYNQAQRKLREAELEKRELEKKLSEKDVPEKVEKKEDDFFEDEKPPVVDAASIVDEKLKPVLDRIDKKEKDDQKRDRTLFFDANPEYRDNAESFNELLEIMDKNINPDSGEYSEQLNMAHIIRTGRNMGNTEVADKKREMAGDAASAGDEAQKATAKEEFTPEDRKHQKEWNISDEGMRAAKKKLADGSMRIL